MNVRQRFILISCAFSISNDLTSLALTTTQRSPSTTPYATTTTDSDITTLIKRNHKRKRPSKPPRVFDIEQSTEANYADDTAINVGPYASIRDNQLDHSYHATYSLKRQAVQDAILDSLLLNHNNNSTSSHCQPSGLSSHCHSPQHHQHQQWVTFTAGVMGVGKTHTLQTLHEQGLFPLDSFVRIDPDAIRAQLPEYQLYQQQDPETAGHHTHKEASLLAELATHAALERGHNVLVDGSLRNADWYQRHFDKLRQLYPHLKLSILYVTAPLPSILERVWKRATERVVPWAVLEQALWQVPQSIQKLQHLVDSFFELHNSGNDWLNLVAPVDATWNDFANQWCSVRLSSCALPYCSSRC